MFRTYYLIQGLKSKNNNKINLLNLKTNNNLRTRKKENNKKR